MILLVILTIIILTAVLLVLGGIGIAVLLPIIVAIADVALCVGLIVWIFKKLFKKKGP